MKKLSLLIISNLLIANVTSDATITIGAGVTLTTNGDFINNGSILNYGTFDIKGDYTNNFKLENFTGSTLALTGDGDQEIIFTHNEGSTEFGAEYCQQIETEEECEAGICDWDYNDEDNDGVPDIVDKCLGTPYPAVIDAFGCPVDFEIHEFLNIIENPIGSPFSYLYYSETPREIKLELLDLSGKRVKEGTVSFAAESYSIVRFPGMEDLSQGIYILRISDGAKMGSRKLMKK